MRTAALSLAARVFAALLPATLAVATLAPASTRAARMLVIHGAGFGNGVGMSQYGAYGYAKHGFGYAAILAHYYTGTSTGHADPARRVSVLLQGNVSSAAFSGATRAGAHRLRPGQAYTASPSGGGVVLRGPGGVVGRFAGSLQVSGGGPLTLRGTADSGKSNGRYRGALEFRPGRNGGLDAINVVGLEDYTRGVISGEMPAEWPAAALQAQAIAARTYAITSHDGPAGLFDVYATTRSQVYTGIAAETAATDRAVRSTAGQVVTYRGRPAVTFYFDTSGGHTESIQNAFIGSTPEPWLVGVSDPYDDTSPMHRWTVRLTIGQAASRLAGLLKGAFRSIDVLRRGVSPRIVRADVVGSGGRTRVTGEQLQGALHLYDDWAYLSLTNANGRGEHPLPGSGRPPATPPPTPAPPTPAPTGPGGGTSAP